MTKRRWSRRTKWDGVSSEFWRGRYKWRAFNEGGRIACANIVLRDGWLPVALYAALSLPFGGFVRIMPRWRQAWNWQ